MGTPAPLRVAYRDLVVYRGIWKANFAGSFIQPMLYLLGIGLGVGELVDRGPDSAELLGGVSYFGFYSSALLATTAMFTASQQALWPTMDGFQWSNAYRAMVSTPIEPRDVATGLTIYFAARAAVGAVGVAVVLALFDDTRSWGLIPAVLAAVLTALAFAVPIAAWTSTRTTGDSFTAIFRFGVMPMFLFSGAFYPIKQLPDWLEPVAWLTPLWHGVELCRGMVLGGLPGAETVGHVAALMAYVVIGWTVCTITFRRRLQP
jgi:lipooligosaccharide transport system permease protein